MRTVKVFIAGSKELENERNCLKAAALELNIKYTDNKIPVRIQMFSYDNLDDTQGTYNKFIEEEADIVIFVVKDRMGNKTEVEFNTATESLKKHGRPKVMFFLHKYKKETPEIARIKGLVYGRLGGYYVEYSSSEWGDFKSKVRERIERYVKDLKIPPTPPALKCRRGLILLCSIIGVLAVLAGCLIWQLCVTPVQLVFAGGGSVKNFIEEEKGIDIVEYPHSVYLNMPSGNAWALLAEEIIREQENGKEKENPFATICLSADEIDTATVFSGGKNRLFDDHVILKYKLGEDPLVVYVSKDFIKEKRWLSDSSSILKDSLCAMLRYAMSGSVRDSVKVFMTSSSSGTFCTYQSCFYSVDSVNELRIKGAENVCLFCKNSEANYIRPEKNKSYIILGSQYYRPQGLSQKREEVGKYYALYVYDSVARDGKLTKKVSKSVNLYFLGTKKSPSDDCCTIKKPIIDFLKAIHAEKNMDSTKWNELKRGQVQVGPCKVEDLNGNGK